MYTLGSSAVKHIRTELIKQGQPTVLTDAFLNKVVAFVGTKADREGDGTINHPPTILAPNMLYFEVASTTANPHEISQPIFNAVVYVTAYNGEEDAPIPDEWIAKGTIDGDFVFGKLFAAGGYMNGLYCLPRGNSSDKGAAPKVDGLPYYARDNQNLYVWDAILNRHVSLSGAGQAAAVGIMVVYPEVLGDPPSGYLRCDGSEVLKSEHLDLFVLYDSKGGDLFGKPVNPECFVLPKADSMIVLAEIPAE